MASDKEAILINIETPPSDFNFQDFHVPTNSSYETTSYNSTYVKGERQAPIGDDIDHEARHSIWSLEYFQKFFDIDTEMVINRIKGSMWPKPGINYLQHHIQSKPDLYGPFWVCITLIFTIAISGNMANYLQAAANYKYHWKYDFHAVTASATTIFLYAWFLPVIWWGVLKFHGNEHFQLTLLELICVYGYSLSVYIPISILWVIQVNLIQWLLVIVGTAVSGYVLVTSLGPAFGSRNYLFLLIIISLKVLLAVGFMLYFFHVPPMTAKH